MLVQVHDELIFEIPKGEKERCIEVISKEMEGAFPLSVPLKVDVACGASWPK
jgi:DNA polymerase-1